MEMILGNVQNVEADKSPPELGTIYSNLHITFLNYFWCLWVST